MKTIAFLFIACAEAFPFVARAPGVDSSPLSAHYRAAKIRRQQTGEGAGGPATCPYNADHVPAAAYNPAYPYNEAQNGLPGLGKGGYLVPAVGDTDHEFIAPGPNDIRGPCPGLNTAANHNFLARDGITTFNELVDAQQNLYNVGYDLAVTLALLGLTLTDGDIVTEKLSIGCDATTRTSYNPALTGSEPGLDGHNKFEGDTSLTRNDFFLDNGNDFSFNGTLFGMMQDTCNGNFDLTNLGLYRYQRYQQSLAENPDFYFGPLSLLLFGAASFLYELMPSGTHNYAPDLETISSFFGASQNSDGTWYFNHEEKIPDNWTNRVTPYSDFDVGAQIFEMYGLHPVAFGGNTGDGTFNGLPDWQGVISGGMLTSTPTESQTTCLLYMLATENIPGYANSVVTPSVDTLAFVLKKLGETNYANLGCPRPLT